MTIRIKGVIKATKEKEKPTDILRVIILEIRNYRLYKCF